MAQIKKLTDKNGNEFYPLTHVSAIYFEDGVSLEEREIIRDSAEDIRKSNETQRQTDEATRKTDEIDRKSSEVQRKADEVIRKSNEEQRELAEANRVEFYDNFQTGLDSKADKVKVASIEKDLKSYQNVLASVNVNQEAKQSVTGHGVVNLPKNSANGQVSVGVKGLTATNLVKNGNFTNGVGSWSGVIANLSANNGILKITKLDTGGAFGSAEQSGIFQNGRKYFIKCRARNVGSYQAGSLMLRQSSTVLLRQNSPIINTWYSLMSVFTADSTDALRLTVNGIGTESTEMEVQEVMAIDLTANGLENKTVEELNTMFANYFDGTKSTNSVMRLKSVGKNLFDGKLVQGKVNLSNGQLEVSPTTVRNSKPIKVRNNINHIISLDGIWKQTNNIYYDKDFNFISSETVSSSTKYFITPSNCNYLIYFYTGTTNDKIQLEEGTVTTPYEPYAESTLYINASEELRSLPNGTKDEIRVSEGKLLQRTKKYVLQASDVMYLLKTNTNNDVIYVKKPLDYIGYNNATSHSNSVLINGFTMVYKPTLDALDNINNIHSNQMIDKFYITLPKGIYVDLADAQTKLTGTTLTYQLSEPIITPIQTSGVLLSYPSGTIYAEKAVADAGVYSSGISVLNQGLPIKEIESISKVNFNTGVEIKLDVSKAVIETDKLSFTHFDLTDGDIVFFTYFHAVESTQGELKIEYYDSRHTLKDSVTGKFYKVVPTVANGVLTNTLVEV